MEEGATSQGTWVSLAAGKSKGPDSPPELPEGTDPASVLMSDSDLRNCYDDTLVLFRNRRSWQLLP